MIAALVTMSYKPGDLCRNTKVESIATQMHGSIFYYTKSMWGSERLLTSLKCS